MAYCCSGCFPDIFLVTNGVCWRARPRGEQLLLLYFGKVTGQRSGGLIIFIGPFRLSDFGLWLHDWRADQHFGIANVAVLHFDLFCKNFVPVVY